MIFIYAKTLIFSYNTSFLVI